MEGPLHALDLPVLRTSPSYGTLMGTLDRLTQPPPTFLRPPAPGPSSGTLAWLTRLVASPLAYLSDAESEEVLRRASEVMSRACGRTAMPDLTRTFVLPSIKVPGGGGGGGEDTPGVEKGSDSVEITLFEPTLTADALGLKTWCTSFLLARVLGRILADPVPGSGPRASTSPRPENGLPTLTDGKRDEENDWRGKTVLELGSGTGLVGLAAAKILPGPPSVTLTDYLPEITANLRRNVETNVRGAAAATTTGRGSVRVAMLDWTEPAESPVDGERFDLVLASDFLYHPAHAPLVVAMLTRFSRPPAGGDGGEGGGGGGGGGLVLAAYPLRPSNVDFIADFARLMAADSLFTEIRHGVECGFDDWGNAEVVRCHWHLYVRSG